MGNTQETLEGYMEVTETLVYAVIQIHKILDDMMETNDLKLSQKYVSASELKERGYIPRDIIREGLYKDETV